MDKQINLHEIKEKILIKLEKSGWDRVLKPFILSSDFDNIINALVKDYNEGKRFTPTLKDMFKAFELCPYEDLKMVVVGQDPYYTINVADGLAFSCSKGKLQPSLRIILNEIDRKVYNNQDVVNRDGDLTRWAEQGILLLNTALSTNVGKPGAHVDIWKPFTDYLLDTLNIINNGLIYLYLGNKAKQWMDYTNDNNYKFALTHPASAAYKGSVWETGDCFNQITELLDRNFKHKMIW